jgi:peptidyl-tRNA hydrolase, PTH1 family
VRRRGTARARWGRSADLLVVGLGNPGAEYAHTRHNVGADAVEMLAALHRVKLRRSKAELARAVEKRLEELQVVFAVPDVWMNDSGSALRLLVPRYRVEPDQLVVVHDELDLPVGVTRVKVGGGMAGHRGLRSISAHLHTDDFARVRIGIGKPPSAEQGADHVLDRFAKHEQADIAIGIQTAVDAVNLIIEQGVDAAMNRYNTRAG